MGITEKECGEKVAENIDCSRSSQSYKDQNICKDTDTVAETYSIRPAANLLSPVQNYQNEPVRSRETTPREAPLFKLLRSSTFDFVRGVVHSVSGQLEKSKNTIKEYDRIATHHTTFKVHLRARLLMARQTSPMCQRNFIPELALQELVTSSSVQRELSRPKYLPQKLIHPRRRPQKIRVEPKKQEEYGQLLSRARSKTTTLVEQDDDRFYQRVFAILAYIGRSNRIWAFVDEGVCDTDLPILEIGPAIKNKGTFKLRGRQEAAWLSCFKHWTCDAITEFLDAQWIFLPPMFRMIGTVVEHQPFQKEEILPMLTWNPAEKGGSGEVYKAEIHQDYHSFGQRFVAVKKLTSSKHEDPKIAKAAFEMESEILKNLSRDHHKHDHLIRLLASFEQDQQYYLVFPWANADLEVFWCEIEPKSEMSMWLIAQCQGLAEALSIIHRYETRSGTTMFERPSELTNNSTTGEVGQTVISLIGRHGDIKPKNILWFDGEGHYGNLKITDFGIAKFTPENIQKKRNQGFPPNSVTYRSPECDISPESISPQCDVWALGCVYLVFMTWFFGGCKAVNKFAQERVARDEYWCGLDTDNFFTIDMSENPRAMVKEIVTKRIEELRRTLQPEDKVASCFEKFLSLIQDNMLVVRQNLDLAGPTDGRRGSEDEEVQRKSSRQIATALGSIRVEMRDIGRFSSQSFET